MTSALIPSKRFNLFPLFCSQTSLPQISIDFLLPFAVTTKTYVNRSSLLLTFSLTFLSTSSTQGHGRTTVDVRTLSSSHLCGFLNNDAHATDLDSLDFHASGRIEMQE
ncbi:hypothetical protein RYX36_010925 [Vicia faba]